MKTISTYVLSLDFEEKILFELPKNTNFLKVTLDPYNMYSCFLWFERGFYKNSEREDKIICVFPSGSKIEDNMKYIDSLCVNGINYHFYEKVKA